MTDAERELVALHQRVVQESPAGSWVARIKPIVRDLREEFKAKGNVVEIYVHTTELRGREAHFATDFEPPQKDFLDIDTTRASVEASLQQILRAKPVFPVRGGGRAG